MKNLSVILIISAALITIITKYSFENGNSAELLASLLSFFLAPFHTAAPGVSAEPMPFYLMERNANYIINGVAITICLVAAIVEMKNLIKLGRNKRSAAILSIAACLLYLNASIFV